MSASSSTASLDRRLNSHVSDHHTGAVTSLAVSPSPSLSLSVYLFPVSLPLHILLFCPPLNMCVIKEGAADDR